MKEISLILLLLSPFGLWGQSKKLQKNYNEAYQAFQDQKYRQAQDLFDLVTTSGENHPLVQNAYFFSGLASLKADELARAKKTLQDLLEKSPDWKAKDELYYALAEIAFKEENPALALNYINKIPRPKLEPAIEQMKGHFFKNAQIPSLSALLKDFPSDTLLAQSLIDKIASQSDQEKDILFMNDLMYQYKLEAPKKRKISRLKYIRETYKVGVMLPFEIESIKDSSRRSKFSIAFYQGMRMAQKELDSLDMLKVRLYAYDVGSRDRSKVEGMSAANEFDDLDMLLGPIFPDSYASMSNLAMLRGFKVMHPLSRSSDQNLNPNTYLLLPSLESEAIATVDYFNGHYRLKNIVILYDGLSSNKTKAEAIKKYAEERHIEVRAFEEIKTTDLAKVAQVFRNLDSSPLGGIIVSSTSQLIAEEILDHKGKNGFYSLPLFAPSAWLSLDIDLESLKRHNAFFAAPEYLNEESPKVQKFKEAYREFAFREADSFALYGYETLHFFAKLLKNYGTKIDYYADLKKAGRMKGEFMEGLDFSQGNANSYVPILKINNEEVEIVNPIK